MVIAGADRGTGCGTGLMRSTVTTRIITTMMPPMMSHGARDLFSCRTNTAVRADGAAGFHGCTAVRTGFLRHHFQLCTSSGICVATWKHGLLCTPGSDAFRKNFRKRRDERSTGNFTIAVSLKNPDPAPMSTPKKKISG
jgi:hypothetical protein